MGVVISTDSTCDLGSDIIEREKISVFALTVILGDKEYKDGEGITPELIFDYVSQNKVLPKTSAGSVEDYQKHFAKLREGGDEVVHLSISSKASVTHENAKTAAASMSGVYVVDSKALSTGQGLLVMKACDMKKEGKSAEEIFNLLNELSDNVQTSFVVDTMDYLHKGGRCSMGALIATKILKIHPYIDMKEGALGVKRKFMGSLKRCVDLYVNELIEEYKSYDDTRCFVTHSKCVREIVDDVVEKVKNSFSFKEVIETTAGSVITSHCGKNTIGVLFIKK